MGFDRNKNVDVFECYLKTCESKLEESTKYYYGTEENYVTINGKFFNLLNTYEPSLINHTIMYDCFVKHGEKATL